MATEPICFNNMLSKSDRFLLKKIARDSIHYGLMNQAPMALDMQYLPSSLVVKKASFVTLFLTGALRGCIGSTEATQPLADDVAKNAYAGAFKDHRFDPIDEQTALDLEIHISVLSQPQRIDCHSERTLLQQLHPGKDGLIIEDFHCHATFLPAVWEALPNPERFVRQLKRKAGLTEDYWSDTLQCYRYWTETF